MKANQREKMRVKQCGSKNFAEVIAENTAEREYLAGVVAEEQQRPSRGWCKEYLTTIAKAEKIVEGYNHANKPTQSSNQAD